MGSIARNPLSTRNADYVFTLMFETNGTDAPDGLVPAYTSAALTIDQADTGLYEITFAAACRPGALLYASADFLEDLPGYSVKVIGYDAETGVLSVMAYEEDAESGVSAAADSTDKTIQVMAVFSRNDAKVNI